ncbi:hypothetical protein DMUE_4540 [Dictyocoela muelleri]|nr:hypothetical protein DMUE_4540 [Dictyocoela muelleri]
MLKKMIDDYPTITLRSLAKKLENEEGVIVSPSTINRCLDNFCYSLKCTNELPVDRNSISTIKKRFIYEQKFSELSCVTPPESFIFIDEVEFSLSLRIKKGRSERGKPVNIIKPASRSKNISIIASYNINGMLFCKNNDKAVNGDEFVDFMIDINSNVLSKGIKDPIFIMDNARIHHYKKLETICAEHNIKVFYLPSIPHSLILLKIASRNGKIMF